MLEALAFFEGYNPVALRSQNKKSRGIHPSDIALKKENQS